MSPLLLQTLWVLLVDLALWGLGWELYRRLLRRPGDEEPLSEAVALSLVLGMVGLGSLLLVLGLCHLLYREAVVGLVLASAALGLARGVQTTLARGWGFAPLKPDALVLVVLALTLPFMLQCYVPELVHDSNVYHLGLPQTYMRFHGMVALPHNLYANMPHNLDLLFALPLAGGGVVSAKLFMFQFSVLTIIGLGVFARRHLSPGLGGVLGLLYLASPLVQTHLWITHVEPGVGCLLLFAALLFSRWYEDRRRASLLLCCALLGYVLACKYTAWFFAVGLCGGVIVRSLVLARDREAPWKELALALGAMALPLAPWLVRAWVLTGDPLFPNLHTVLEARWWSEIQHMQFMKTYLSVGNAMGPRSLWGDLQAPWHLMFNAKIFAHPGKPLAPVLLLLLFAAPLLPASYRGVRRYLLLAALLGLALWIFTCPTRAGRFVVGWVPLAVLTAGFTLHWLQRVSPVLWTVGLLAVGGNAWVQAELPAAPWKAFARGAYQQTLEKNPTYQEWQVLNNRLPEGSVVLLMFENRTYFLRHRHWSDSLWEAPSTLAILRRAGSPAAAARVLRSQGVTHLVLHRHQSVNHYFVQHAYVPMWHDKLLPEPRFHAERRQLDQLLTRHAHKLLEAGRYEVYRLAPPGVTAAPPSPPPSAPPPPGR